MWFIVTVASFILMVLYLAKKISLQMVCAIGAIMICAIYVLNAFGEIEQKRELLKLKNNEIMRHSRTESVGDIHPGDILLYRNLRNGNTESIKYLERLEDGPQTREYYHVAIALDGQSRIESDGKKVTVEPIDWGNFDVFRPPIPTGKRDIAIHYMKSLVGESYDWWLVTDDILRYLTHSVVHFPVKFVQAKEEHKKICTTLVVQYFSAASFGPKLNLNVSPEDIYLLVRNYQRPPI